MKKIKLIIKFIIGNPWIFCIFTTTISTSIVWFNLDYPVKSLNKVLIGFLFGLFIGVINLIEILLQLTVTKKRMLGFFIGLIFGILCAILLKLDAIYYCIIPICGSMLGATARDWSKHINFI